jgi:hypothetical protein
MSNITLSANAGGSGIFTIASPSSNTNRTLTLPDNTGTILTTASTFAATGPAFSAYPNANQTVTNSTFTKIALNTELFDTNSCFDSTTNYRFTPTVAGYYQVNASMGFTGTVTRVIIDIYKNGSEYLRGTDLVVTGNNVSTSSLVYCNGTTDYLEAFAFIVGSGTLTVVGNSVLTQFSGAMVRGA